MGLTMLSAGSARALLIAASTCSVTLLPSMAYAWRDYASLDAAPQSGWIGWLVAGGALAGALTYVAADNFGQFVWPLVALVFNLGAAIWAVERWKTMVNAPAAFPVGHMAR
jgi:hypothetical protein